MSTTHTTSPALRTVDDQPHISHATYEFMRAEIARLQAENLQLKMGNEQLHRELAVQEQQTNHWYMKATYTPAEIREMYVRRSKGKNEFTGTWLTPDEQAAYDAMEQLAHVAEAASAAAPVVHLEQDTRAA